MPLIMYDLVNSLYLLHIFAHCKCYLGSDSMSGIDGDDQGLCGKGESCSTRGGDSPSCSGLVLRIQMSVHTYASNVSMLYLCSSTSLVSESLLSIPRSSSLPLHITSSTSFSMSSTSSMVYSCAIACALLSSSAFVTCECSGWGCVRANGLSKEDVDRNSPSTLLQRFSSRCPRTAIAIVLYSWFSAP